MDGKGSKINGSFAGTLTSYSPPRAHATSAAGEKLASPERLALVVPTLHEAQNLTPLLERVRAALASVPIDWEVIVVDDDSRDGTDSVVAAIAQDDPRIRLLVRRGERGLSGAILHGWRHTDATILGVMDADGQHPAELITLLLHSVLNGHDIAIGSRYAKGGSRGGNPMRRIASLAAIMAARPLQQPAKARVRDPLSGFFLVRRHCVENVRFQSAGFKLLVEILARGRIRSLEEIPFAFGRRCGGRSKVNIRVAWDYLVLLGRLYRARFTLARLPQAASGD